MTQFVSMSRSGDGALHLWLGPFGLHLFWPDIHKSRLGWCPDWRKPLE